MELTLVRKIAQKEKVMVSESSSPRAFHALPIEWSSSLRLFKIFQCPCFGVRQAYKGFNCAFHLDDSVMEQFYQ